MTSISFVLRTSSKVDSPGSLAMRIIHCREVKSITLSGYRLFPHEWNQNTQSVVYPPDNPERSSYLKTVEWKIKSEKALVGDYVKELDIRGHYCTDDIISLYRQKSNSSKLLGYTGLLARELEQRGQERTARAYRTVANGLIAFNKGVDIPLHQINSHLIKSFEMSLKEKGRLPNTISYYMRNLRAIYNKAIESKYVVNITGEKPFAGVYTGTTKTMKRALSLDELKSLHSLDFARLLKEEKPESQKHSRIDKLYFAWRLFFFCFYTRGMCFIDLAYLRKDNIKDGVIQYCRKKTGQQVEIKITADIQKIIDSFAPDVKYSPYVFPIIKDNRRSARLQYESALRLQNRRLLLLSGLACTRSFSTHVSRHTWATIGKRANVPLQVISECLGHASEKTTLIYMGLLDNSILDEANDLITSTIAFPQLKQTMQPMGAGAWC